MINIFWISTEMINIIYKKSYFFKSKTGFAINIRRFALQHVYSHYLCSKWQSSKKNCIQIILTTTLNISYQVHIITRYKSYNTHAMHGFVRTL